MRGKALVEALVTMTGTMTMAGTGTRGRELLLPSRSPTPPTPPTRSPIPYGTEGASTIIGGAFAALSFVVLGALACMWWRKRQLIKRSEAAREARRVAEEAERRRERDAQRVPAAAGTVPVAVVAVASPVSASGVVATSARGANADADADADADDYVPIAAPFLVAKTHERLPPKRLADELVANAQLPPADAQRLMEARVDSLALQLDASDARLRAWGIASPESRRKIQTWVATVAPLESAIDGAVLSLPPPPPP